MYLLYFTLWCLVTVAMLWDMRRSHRHSQAMLERIETSAERIAASAERIAQLTAEVLRRTPAP